MPPSKFIVTNICSPKGGFLIRGIFLLRGGDYVCLLYFVIGISFTVMPMFMVVFLSVLGLAF